MIDEEAFENSVRQWLSELPTLPELETLVGDLSAEERELLARLDLAAEPTDEELHAIGPAFVQRLLDRLFPEGRLRDRTGDPGGSPSETIGCPSVAEGITLLELLAEVELAAMLRGDNTTRLSRKMVDVAEETADLFLSAVKARASRAG